MNNYDILKFILGTGFVGGIVSYFFNYILSSKLKNKEARLKIIIDKFLDRKIGAYDKVIDFVNLTRTMSVFENNKIDDLNVNFDKYDYPLRYPIALGSNKNFSEYEVEFLNLNNIYGRWLNTNITRELNFLQDYIVTLDSLIKNLNDSEIREVGVTIRQDFIDIASNLEKLSFDFYSNGIFKLKIEDKNEWHKYKKEETYERFDNTMLSKYMEDIKKLQSRI